MRFFVAALLLLVVSCGPNVSRTGANGDEILLVEAGTLVEITGRLGSYLRATEAAPGKLEIDGRRYTLAPGAGVTNESDVEVGALVRVHGQATADGMLAHVFVQRAFAPTTENPGEPNPVWSGE